MKKTAILIIFYLAAAFSFAVELPDRSLYLYIEGNAEQEDHRTFFMTNFMLEAAAVGLYVAAYRDEAGLTFRFYVQSHYDEYDPSINYIILVSLIDNELDAEIVSFGWTFAEIEDMEEYTHSVFHTAAAIIPRIIGDEYEHEVTRVVHEITYITEIIVQEPVHDDRWQRQRFYIRASIDYPIAFYLLQSTGLLGGQAAYGPDPDYPLILQHLDNLVIPRPGITVGFEWLFLNSMSIELAFKGNFGDPRSLTFFNMGLGARLNYIFRTRDFMIQPYGAFFKPLTVSPEFYEVPPFAVGGGIQIGVRGGRNGVFFIDSNIMIPLGDVYRYNPYTVTAPYPRRIHYRRFTFGFGIGYKFWPFGGR